MSNQTIGTVNVQVGSSNPRAVAINYGGQFALKLATDLNMLGAADGDAIVYQSSSHSFILEPVSGIGINNIDNGLF